MNERPGSAMRLLYQLFVALNRMKVNTPLPLYIATLISSSVWDSFTEAATEWTVSGIHTKSGKSKTGESGDFHISRGIYKQLSMYQSV